MTLTFQKLREANIERCKEWHGPAGIEDWTLSDWATATAGELGEACNVIKKLNRARSGIYGNSQTEQELQEQLAEELADTVIYLDLLAARAEIDLASAVVDKFNFVSTRFGFSQRLGERPVKEQNTPLPVGTLVRTGAGPTALMLITEIRSGHGGSVARYYGIHCMGGYCGAYHEAVTVAKETDEVTWNKSYKHRGNASRPKGSLVGVVEGG